RLFSAACEVTLRTSCTSAIHCTSRYGPLWPSTKATRRASCTRAVRCTSRYGSRWLAIKLRVERESVTKAVHLRARRVQGRRHCRDIAGVHRQEPLQLGFTALRRLTLPFTNWFGLFIRRSEQVCLFDL